MKTIPAGKFKDTCLKTLDEVAHTHTVVIITKRGQPVAKLVPYKKAAAKKPLAGSVLEEIGNPFGTGESWNANSS